MNSSGGSLSVFIAEEGVTAGRVKLRAREGGSRSCGESGDVRAGVRHFVWSNHTLRGSNLRLRATS